MALNRQQDPEEFANRGVPWAPRYLRILGMSAEASRPIARLFLIGGGLLILLAALADPNALDWLREEPMTEKALALAEGARNRLAIAACATLAVGFFMRRFERPRSRGAQRLVLVLACLGLPLFAAETFLAPLVDRGTTLYLRDPELGWRHKPGAEDIWHGVPIRINSKGLRGPEREYAKPRGTKRILFLGDSVTFGFRNPNNDKVLPAQVERLLNEPDASPLECINSGVDGYSPWQEHLFLKREGLRYDPDLVVFSFVLNDVTEKMSLRQFGGESEGFQIENSVFAEGLTWVRKTNIGLFAGDLGKQLDTPGEGELRPGELSAYELLLNPDSPPVQEAWRLTLQSIERIVRTCREKHVPLLIVAFPYTIQVAKPEFDRPQRILGQFCEVQQVPYLDLQGPIVRELTRLGKTDEHFFLDAIHPNDAGYLFCAQEIARVVRERRWIAK